MDLANRIEQYRVDFPDAVRFLHLSADVGARHCVLAERYVRSWLDRAGFVTDDGFPRAVGPYRLTRNGHNVLVQRDFSTLTDFDLVGRLGEVPLIVEVKSKALWDYPEKVDRSLSLGKEIFGPHTQLLVFVPYSTTTKRKVYALQAHRDVTVIDLRYKPKQLRRATDRVFAAA